jgi:uncharacterized protein (DUF302 family)
MPYYIAKILDMPFEAALEKVNNSLKAQGFGVITEIDMQAKLKEKLDVDFRKYIILGACIPAFAYEALQKEDKIGTMLPCNVIVQETQGGTTEVAAIDPVASMMAIQDPNIEKLAGTVKDKLQKMIDSL